jgi:hypothetical protein
VTVWVDLLVFRQTTVVPGATAKSAGRKRETDIPTSNSPPELPDPMQPATGTVAAPTVARKARLRIRGLGGV